MKKRNVLNTQPQQLDLLDCLVESQKADDVEASTSQSTTPKLEVLRKEEEASSSISANSSISSNTNFNINLKTTVMNTESFNNDSTTNISSNNNEANNTNTIESNSIDGLNNKDDNNSNEFESEQIQNQNNEDGGFEDVGDSEEYENSEETEDSYEFNGSREFDEFVYKECSIPDEITIEEVENPDKIPTFSKNIKNFLPPILKQIITFANDDDTADMLLLGAISVLSACMPNVYGFYGDIKSYTNLYLFVIGTSAKGKGKLGFCRKLVEPIDDYLQEQSGREITIYKRKLTEYKETLKNNPSAVEPQKPQIKTLLLSTDTTAASFIKEFADNGGDGLYFTTEADGLTTSLESKYGHFSDKLRDAFHHEPISYSRKTEDEKQRIKNPRLSIVLSGTPEQTRRLIHNVENGLFSRFIFYQLEAPDIWDFTLFNNKHGDLGACFEKIGKQCLELYKKLNASQPIQILLTKYQAEKFHFFFAPVLNEEGRLYGEGFGSSVKRLGLITFRIIMILTILHSAEKDEFSNEIICDDDDFNMAIVIAKSLLRHSLNTFEYLTQGGLPKTGRDAFEKLKNDQLDFLVDLQRLPKVFTRQEYLEVANKHHLKQKTADRWVGDFIRMKLVERVSHGHYSAPDLFD